MNFFLSRLLAVVSFAGAISFGHAATTFTIDSLDGDITANELKQFTNSIKNLVPPVNNYGDNMSTHGTEVQGMARMYEATGDMNVLNRLIVFMDIALVHRNDEPLGENRVMWTGNVEPGWPEAVTNTTPACSSGEVCGNIAYCARLILETPSIWNLTVPDGNPYGYGVTYKQRAQTYLAKVDQGLGQYITVWFVDTNTFKIHNPSDARWRPASGNDSAETSWNRQALFVMGYQHAAECHDILGDNPSFLSLYKGVVNQFATWFTTAYPSGGSLYYTNNGIRVAKWYYQIPTDQHIENIGHAQHDLLGLYQNLESGYTGLTDSQMKVYADTTQFIINLGATNSWADNVDGTGSSTYLKIDFIFLAQWNPALYKMIAQADIDAGQVNGSDGCANTAYILWMKHWFWVQSQDFILSATPASAATTPGGTVTYTLSASAINGFNSNIGLSITGLPAGATASFSPGSITGSGSSTLTVTTASSTPAGSSTLTLTGAGGGRTHSISVSLVISDFNITATPSSQSVVAGNTTTYTVNLGSINGFSGTVSLGASGLPAGTTATFSPASLNPAGSATLTVTTSASTPAATSTLTITGTSGSLQHSATVTLVVTAAPLNWTTVNDTGGGITYSAGWGYSTNRNLGDYNNDAHYNKTNGNYAQLTFTGTAVRYITETYSDEGNVDVYIDGILQTTVNCNTSTRQVQFVAYSNTGLSAGSHTIKVIKSSGTFMLLDAFAYVPSSTTNVPAPVQVNLASSFNRSNGLVADGATFTGGLDNGGAAYSANVLGNSITNGGVRFNLGPANALDCISATGQTIALPAGNYTALKFIGTGVQGNQASQTFIVNYSDGTSTTLTQSMSDWFTPQSYTGETTAATMAYRDLSSGATDNRTFRVYAYSLALNNAKTVSSLKLPANANVEILAITLTP